MLTLLDGAMGTLLPGDIAPPLQNVNYAHLVRRYHSLYVEAGAQMILTNTFAMGGIQPFLWPLLIKSALQNAAAARPAAIGLSLGPLPPGANVWQIYSRLISLGANGANCIFLETMTNLDQAIAAVQTARQCCDLPVYVCCTFSGNTMADGTHPATAAAALTRAGASAVGVNCGANPKTALLAFRQMAAASPAARIFKPSAGLPDPSGCYPYTPPMLVPIIQQAIAAGATMVGGCCGTTPGHIAAIARAVK